MTLEAAKKKLKELRGKAAKIKEEIIQVRKIMIEIKGRPKIDKEKIIVRNVEMYIKNKAGKSYAEISDEYNLSTGHVASACKKV